MKEISRQLTGTDSWNEYLAKTLSIMNVISESHKIDTPNTEAEIFLLKWFPIMEYEVSKNPHILHNFISELEKLPVWSQRAVMTIISSLLAAVLAESS